MRIDQRLWLPLLICGTASGAQTPNSIVSTELKTVNERLDTLFALDLSPGMSVVVVNDGKVVYLRGFGRADREAGRAVTPDTVFYIDSATKSFLGMLCAQLSVKEKLDLEQDLSSSLPAATFHADVDPGEITLHDLLTHTHGIEDAGPVTFRLAYTGEHSTALLNEILVEHDAATTGRKFKYGNIGFNVAGMALDATQKKPWKDLLALHLLDPLGMSSTTGYKTQIPAARLAMPYSAEPDGFRRAHDAKSDANMHSAGGLVSTARDLGHWLRANLNEGALGEKQVIDPAAVKLAHGPHVPATGQSGNFRDLEYGYGLHTGEFGDELVRYHFGSFTGFGTHVSFLPEREMGVAILVNTDVLGMHLADLVSRTVYMSLLGQPLDAHAFKAMLEESQSMAQSLREQIRVDRETRAMQPQELPRAEEAYTGEYTNPLYGDLVFELAGSELDVHMGRMWSDVEVFDPASDAFRVELTGSGAVATFTFVEGEEAARSVKFMGLEFTRAGD